MRRHAHPLVASSCFVALLLAPPALAQCTDLDGDGYFVEDPCAGIPDCNDAEAGTNPGAAEVCDGYDNDCSGFVDDDPSCDTTCDPAELIGDSVPMPFNPNLADNVVWTGSEFGVIRGDNPSGDKFLGRYDVNGDPVANEQYLYTHVGGGASLVWTGSEYVAFWERSIGISMQRFDPTGLPLSDPMDLTTDWYTSAPRAVWSGSQFGVAWTVEVDGSWDTEIRFARLDASLAPLGVTESSERASTFRLVWTGADFALLYNYDGTRLLRLDSGGSLIGPPVSVRSCIDSCAATAIVWNGSGFGVTVTEWTGQPHAGAYFGLLDPSGQPIGEFRKVSNRSGDSSLGFSGSQYAVTSGYVGSSNFQLLDAAGNTIGDELGDGPFWRVFWNGDTFGVFDGDEYARVGCNCNDGDSDGTSVCNDCDDDDDRIYPAAAEVCDGVNNDCNDPVWPALSGVEADDDGDTLSECAGDCDDTEVDVYPGAPQICDGLNNDCDDAGYPTPPADQLDDDGDTFIACAECDDGEIDVYPGAPQICDGLNNDCDDGAWPTVPPDDADADADGFAICDGDCADDDATRFPDAEEVCNDLDDDCDTLVDEDASGEDTDGDTVHNLCDNCPDVYNTNQFDEDEDGRGNSCDNCLVDHNPDQADQDGDTHGDVCDNCPSDANPNQNDFDEDGGGDACDCAVTDPDIYPDAPEINDGADNQCPGDYGYGMVDETSGDSGFHDPANKHAYSWAAQAGATSYEAVRSAIPDFAGGCASTVTGATLWIDLTEPGPYGLLAYLNRPLAPNVGSWGPDSAGERTGVCP